MIMWQLLRGLPTGLNSLYPRQGNTSETWTLVSVQHDHVPNRSCFVSLCSERIFGSSTRRGSNNAKSCQRYQPVNVTDSRTPTGLWNTKTDCTLKDNLLLCKCHGRGVQLFPGLAETSLLPYRGASRNCLYRGCCIIR